MADGVQEPLTAGKGSSPETLNLESLGIALAITWFAMMLWSPVAVPVSFVRAGLDFQMHLLRLVLLGALCVVYLVVQFFPVVVHRSRIKFVAVAVGVAVSPFALLVNVVPAFAELCDEMPLLYVVSWACTGFSAAMMMLIWGYDMSTKVSYRQGVVNVAASSMFSGAFFFLTAFLQREAASVMTMVVPFAMLVTWIICMRQRRGEEPREVDAGQIAHPAALNNVRLVLGKATTVFIFSYGFIMGIAGSIGTQLDLSRYAFIYVGLSTLAAGVVMCVVLRSNILAVSRKTFLWFLPFAVACLFLMSVVDDVGKVVLLFAIFFVVNSYNVINTAYLGENQDKGTYSQTYDLFSSESRSADMIGSAIGWGLGVFVQFVVDGALVPYCYFLIAVTLVGVTIASFFRMEDENAQEPDRKAAIGSVLEEWEEVCANLSERYRFSSRESEIFLLLSRGRDRQYIHGLLYIAPSTVRTHTYNIYQKMGIHNQQELIDVVEAEFLKR